MRHLRLVGAGHAHLAVLLHLKKQRLAKQQPKNTEVGLIFAERYQRYSGMLPAWMAGHATEAEMSIDIAPLCAAGVTWIQDDLVSMDAALGYLSTSHHPALHYDILSLNTGAQIKLSGLSAIDTPPLLIHPLLSLSLSGKRSSSPAISLSSSVQARRQLNWRWRHKSRCAVSIHNIR